MIKKLLFVILVILALSAGLTEAEPNPLKNSTEIGVFTTQKPHGAEFYENYLFIADENSLLIYNMSDPERPGRITRFTGFSASARVNGLSVSEDRLYIAAGPGWVYVLNITNPENPKILYQLNYLNSANDVAIDEKYMYVADANTGMLIFDLTNRINPELIGEFYVLRANISGTLHGWGGISVEVSGRYAFLSAANRKGFYIIDVNDPARPTEVFRSFGKNVYDIAISGKDVYLARADGSAQFDLMNVSNPYSPKITDNISILKSVDRSAIAVHPSGNYIYAAAGDTWHIFRIPDVIPPQIIINEPEDGEITSNRNIGVAGTAFDKSGIVEVRVNGIFAGTDTWDQMITLEEGINNITIVASDKNWNNITERIQVIYRPAPVTDVSTPAPQQVNITPVPIEGERINLIFILYGVIALTAIVLIYWVYKTKR